MKFSDWMSGLFPGEGGGGIDFVCYSMLVACLDDCSLLFYFFFFLC